ncbi:YqiA/YcfP family alpha/beta fold hydrolase [Halomonas sp. MCCC 1A11062]|uniref:YqiA/YcfP family alpha/beta fold hydrolase n=1 Tax=Halomonas sp. MCCC 1A11062 TaxID=2733485 RepID=UPI001F4507B9|nr:YqiA/YcfP family alpha/beta fold hydrolase [Halomonas sp. MCCC 1A11062]MCE8039281.1 alpha/beta hydrolase [Halomonas sp. MCCC 1A11062]
MKLIFSHGKESGPYGHKIITLAQIAMSKGLHVQSLDYQGIADPEARAEKLIEVLSLSKEPHLLVGSSMGAYVSLVASQTVPVAGLFLMAPAVGLPGYAMQEGFDLQHIPTTIIHGWRDEVVPVSHVVTFAGTHRANLHVLDSDHRLSSVLPEVSVQFLSWLDSQLR